MNAIEALHAVRLAGGSVEANGSLLTVHAPADLSPLVWDALAANKATLLDLLTPRLAYADLALREEREAIQNEEAAHAAPTFSRPAPARRCILMRSADARLAGRGITTLPSGLAGHVIDDPAMIDRDADRLAVSRLLDERGSEGASSIAVLLDGLPVVLDSTSVLILTEGESLP